MFHKVIPVFNGTFSVGFEGMAKIPPLENIHSFVFVVIDENNEAVLVDTGFSRDFLPGKGSTCCQSIDNELPGALEACGIRTADIQNVVMTHLHWDHTGGMAHLPNASFYVQFREISELLHLNPNEETYYCPSHWEPLLDRIQPVNGDFELKPGLRLLYTGGHTAGHQVVEVTTRSGTVIIGGDIPFDYEYLWKIISKESWAIYRKGYGSRFYWKQESWDSVKKWVAVNRPLEERGVPVSFQELQKSGNPLFLSHDPGLLNNRNN